MKPTRMTTASVVALVAAVSLTACAQGSATKTEDSKAGGPVTVRYMNFSSNGGHEKDLDSIVKAFEAANTGIKVQVETVPYDSYFTKLQTSVAGGTAADA